MSESGGHSSKQAPKSAEKAQKSHSGSHGSSSSNKSNTPNKKIQATNANTPTSSNSSGKSTASEFLCKSKYLNTLPDIPFDPKLLVYPFDPLRFIKYATTTLERTYKHILHTEPDLGVSINLIDPAAYRGSASNGNRKLHDADQQLLRPLAEVDGTTGSAKKEKYNRPAVAWLHKTKYMTNEPNLPKFRNENIESQTGWGARNLKEKEMKREDQIHAIENTFEMMNKPPVHPTNPQLKPIEILPILPDVERWPNSYSQVVFDTDPVNTVSHSAMSENDRKDAKLNAIIKGFSVEGAKSFIAYMIPKKRKREEDEDDLFGETDNGNSDEEEYEWVREYVYDVKTGKDFADTYFFTITPDAVYYDEIGTRVSLMKYKDVGGSFAQPIKITAQHRSLNEEELKQREARTAALTGKEASDVWDINEQDA